MPQVFAERGGFVLLDPERLDDVMPLARGRDLLEVFLTSAAGDEAARSGAVIPILGVEDGWYDLVVCSDEDVVQTPPAVVSTGWVLETRTGQLLLGPLACLLDWDPDDPRHLWATVPPGAYAVEVHGHHPAPQQSPRSAGSYAWVLRPTAARPWFTADLEDLRG